MATGHHIHSTAGTAKRLGWVLEHQGVKPSRLKELQAVPIKGYRVLDEAGNFLIQAKEYEDGLALFGAAAERFPETAMFHAGVGCCAGHMDRHEEALNAAHRTMELEPSNQAYVNDLGWSQVLAGNLDEALEMLERAVAMDPSDELARENLARCKTRILERDKKI